MSYQIRSIEFHEAAMERDIQRNKERLDYDVEDVGLSSWASDQMITFHRRAIRLLETGQDIGIDEPAAERLLLVDEDYNVVSFNWYDTRYGASWRLSKEATKKYGRGWIPFHDNSRIQRQLGLRQITLIWPCSRWMKTYCSGIGSPVSFRPQFLTADEIANHNWSEEFKSSIIVSL